MIAQHLNLLQEEENRGAKMVADWHRQSLMHPNALNTMEEEEIELSAVQQPRRRPTFDATHCDPLSQRRDLMGIHQESYRMQSAAPSN